MIDFPSKQKVFAKYRWSLRQQSLYETNNSMSYLYFEPVKPHGYVMKDEKQFGELAVSCPVSTAVNVENNEIRTENNEVSGHILLALCTIRLTFVSHYSAFLSVRGTEMFLTV